MTISFVLNVRILLSQIKTEFVKPVLLIQFLTIQAAHHALSIIANAVMNVKYVSLLERNNAINANLAII
jgi:hypothetical protein